MSLELPVEILAKKTRMAPTLRRTIFHTGVLSYSRAGNRKDIRNDTRLLFGRDRNISVFRNCCHSIMRRKVEFSNNLLQLNQERIGARHKSDQRVFIDRRIIKSMQPIPDVFSHKPLDLFSNPPLKRFHIYCESLHTFQILLPAPDNPSFSSIPEHTGGMENYLIPLHTCVRRRFPLR